MTEEMDEMTERVLRTFQLLSKNQLDLHALFEAGGNDPSAREQVIDVVAQLVDEGYLEPRGSDFYSLTEKGRKTLES